MIPNFDEFEQQLKRLAPVINSFKSEQVQIRLIELMFQGNAPGDAEDDTPPKRKALAKKRKVKSKENKLPSATKQGGDEGTSKKRRSVGAATVFNELLEEGFFSSGRTISEIREFASANKARNFKVNELSSPLARFVRTGRLNRAKNADGQYEYTNA